MNVKHIAQNRKHLVCACVLALGNLTLVLVLRSVFEDKLTEMWGNTKYCTDVIFNLGKSYASRFFKGLFQTLRFRVLVVFPSYLIL